MLQHPEGSSLTNLNGPRAVDDPDPPLRFPCETPRTLLQEVTQRLVRRTRPQANPPRDQRGEAWERYHELMTARKKAEKFVIVNEQGSAETIPGVAHGRSRAAPRLDRSGRGVAEGCVTRLAKGRENTVILCLQGFTSPRLMSYGPCDRGERPQGSLTRRVRPLIRPRHRRYHLARRPRRGGGCWSP